jgi:hypothetical protein
MPSPAHGPNCWQCQFFGVSYDPRMPYACKRYGFRTKVLPAIEVLRVDGQFCMGFVPKPETPTSQQNQSPKPSDSQAPKGKPNAGFGVETWV